MVSVEDYGELHQACLQTLMGHGAIETKEFDKIFEKIWQHFLPDTEVDPEALDNIINIINKKNSPFDQKISKLDYTLTNKEFFVFFSSASTSTSKLQNFYSEAELDFFKLLLTKITENEELRITPREALNISSQIEPKIKKMRAQKLLDGWITSGYFHQLHSDNQIYFGIKTLTEFKEILQKMELAYCKTCMLCENIAIWGDRCRSCETIFHSKCIQKFLSRHQKCPSCKERWETQTDGDENIADN